MNNNLEERDKLEWVKCKDLVQNYEYISISPKSLSIIIGVSEQEITDALSEKDNTIKNRFIINKYIENEETKKV